MSLHVILALVVGTLAGAGVWLLLQRSMFQLVLGVGMLGHATNLFIFAVGGLTRHAPPLADAGTVWADPLPQALILTAIVIGMGLQLFLVNKAREPRTLNATTQRSGTEEEPQGDIEDTDLLIQSPEVSR